MAELTAIWIGDAEGVEFSAAVRLLAEQTLLTKFANLSSTHDWLMAGNPVPDLILLAQSYPGQFTAKEMQSLRNAAPLARIITLLGTWCEGESRTGNPVPGTIRVYWHQFESRCLQELQQLRSGRCLTWGLAATATDDERLLMTNSRPMLAGSDNPPAGLAAIVTANRELAGALSAVCRIHGLSSVSFTSGQEIRATDVTVVLWDAPTPVSDRTIEFHRLKEASNNAPIIALVDFPRTEDRTDMLRLGANHVLSKPLYLLDLLTLPLFAKCASKHQTRNTKHQLPGTQNSHPHC